MALTFNVDLSEPATLDDVKIDLCTNYLDETLALLNRSRPVAPTTPSPGLPPVPAPVDPDPHGDIATSTLASWRCMASEVLLSNTFTVLVLSTGKELTNFLPQWAGSFHKLKRVADLLNVKEQILANAAWHGNERESRQIHLAASADVRKMLNFGPSAPPDAELSIMNVKQGLNPIAMQPVLPETAL